MPFRTCTPLNKDWFCSDSMSSLRTTNMNFPLTILVNFSSSVTFIVLFLWSAKYIFAQDGENRWRDADGNWQFEVKGAEEGRVEKILVDLGYLLFANLLVFVKTCKVFNRHYDRMDVGGLAGCTFMFAQMLFVCFWYMINIEAKGAQQSNYNNYNAMSEEQRRLHDQTVVACVSLALGILYSLISFSIYCEGVSMPELHPEDASPWQRRTESDVAKGAMRLERLGRLWMVLGPTTVLTFGIILIAMCCSLVVEGAERLKEEAEIFNLIAILAWMLIVSFGLVVLGRNVLGRQSSNGTLAIGLLAGGGEYFSGLLLLVAILYFSPVLRNRGPEDEHLASIVTSFACLVLSILHLGFALWTKKYKRSISSAIPIEEDEDGYINDDFVHVQGGVCEMELA